MSVLIKTKQNPTSSMIIARQKKTCGASDEIDTINSTEFTIP